MPDLKKLPATVVLGISPDQPEKQAKFDAKYGLGFPLLGRHRAPGGREVRGVGREVHVYGKKYMGIVRSAFVIDEQGKIAAVFYKVSPKDTVPKVPRTPSRRSRYFLASSSSRRCAIDARSCCAISG